MHSFEICNEKSHEGANAEQLMRSVCLIEARTLAEEILYFRRDERRTYVYWRLEDTFLACDVYSDLESAIVVERVEDNLRREVYRNGRFPMLPVTRLSFLVCRMKQQVMRSVRIV